MVVVVVVVVVLLLLFLLLLVLVAACAGVAETPKEARFLHVLFRECLVGMDFCLTDQQQQQKQ